MSVTKINSKVLAIMILWTLTVLIEAPDAPTSMKVADWRHIRSQYNAIKSQAMYGACFIET